MEVKLSIGIVSYNSVDYVKNLLNSIKKNPPSVPYEIIVLDNASEDGSIEFLKKVKGIKKIFLRENSGFSHGCNIIGKRAMGKYILFLNPDVVVTPNALDKLVEFMEKNPQCGVAGGKLLNFDGTLQLSCRMFPTYLNVMFGRESLFRKLVPHNPFSRKYMLYDLDYSKNQVVDWLRGAVFITPRWLFDELGGFDERFFLFLEDTDYCRRVWLRGLKVCYVADAVFYHKLGGSTRKRLIKNRIIHNYSMYKYFLKWTNKNILIEFLLGEALLLRIMILILGKIAESIRE